MGQAQKEMILALESPEATSALVERIRASILHICGVGNAVDRKEEIVVEVNESDHTHAHREKSVHIRKLSAGILQNSPVVVQTGDDQNVLMKWLEWGKDKLGDQSKFPKGEISEFTVYVRPL